MLGSNKVRGLSLRKIAPEIAPPQRPGGSSSAGSDDAGVGVVANDSDPKRRGRQLADVLKQMYEQALSQSQPGQQKSSQEDEVDMLTDMLVNSLFTCSQPPNPASAPAPEVATSVSNSSSASALSAVPSASSLTSATLTPAAASSSASLMTPASNSASVMTPASLVAPASTSASFMVSASLSNSAASNLTSIIGPGLIVGPASTSASTTGPASNSASLIAASSFASSNQNSGTAPTAGPASFVPTASNSASLIGPASNMTPIVGAGPIIVGPASSNSASNSASYAVGLVSNSASTIGQASLTAAAVAEPRAVAQSLGLERAAVREDASRGRRPNASSGPSTPARAAPEAARRPEAVPAAEDDLCARCKQPVVRDAAQASSIACSYALDRVYHNMCFDCTKCGVLLLNQPYFAWNERLLCERCYIGSLEMCIVCKTPICDRIIRALGQAYHSQCFRCARCDRCLDGVAYTVTASNQIYCLRDFYQRFAIRCAACGEPIVPDGSGGPRDAAARVVALDSSFHVHCYRCTRCGNSLVAPDGTVRQSSNERVCDACFDLRARHDNALVTVREVQV